jgi:hypothetical protein
MTERIRYESIQEPLDEEERELMNPDNWDWEHPVEVVLTDDFRIVAPIALTLDQHRTQGAAAEAHGMTLHAFLRQAALMVARAGEEEGMAAETIGRLQETVLHLEAELRTHAKQIAALQSALEHLQVTHNAVP